MAKLYKIRDATQTVIISTKSRAAALAEFMRMRAVTADLATPKEVAAYLQGGDEIFYVSEPGENNETFTGS